MPEAASIGVHPPPERRVKPVPNPIGPRAGINRLSALTQALDLKTQAYADALNPETPVHVRAALMRAWTDLQEITMAIRGQGKPKPVEARNGKPKSKSSNAAPVSERTAPSDKS